MVERVGRVEPEPPGRHRPGKGAATAATGRRDEGGDDGAGPARGAPGCGREQRPSSSPEGSRPAAAAVKHPR